MNALDEGAAGVETICEEDEDDDTSETSNSAAIGGSPQPRGAPVIDLGSMDLSEDSEDKEEGDGGDGEEELVISVESASDSFDSFSGGTTCFFLLCAVSLSFSLFPNLFMCFDISSIPPSSSPIILSHFISRRNRQHRRTFPPVCSNRPQTIRICRNVSCR